MTMPSHAAPDDLSPLKRAILTIEDLKTRLARVESPVPIAVIGMGLPFSGRRERAGGVLAATDGWPLRDCRNTAGTLE